MAILKFSKFKKERVAVKEAKSKQAAASKHLALYTEKLKEFKVTNPSELSEEDQIKFYDSLKPLMEAAEKANASGKDVAELPKDGEEEIEDNGDKDGKEELNDDKGGAKVVTEGDDKGSAKAVVSKDPKAGDIDDKTKDEGKEESGDSGEAKEDQKGAKMKAAKQEGETPAEDETVNASGKVVEAAEKANASGKDVAELPKDGEEEIEEKTEKEKQASNDSAKVVTESASSKTVKESCGEIHEYAKAYEGDDEATHTYESYLNEVIAECNEMKEINESK